MVYLKQVKSKSSYFRYTDACASVGGFVTFIYMFFWLFTKSVNERLLKKRLMEDAFKVRRNKGLLDIKEPKEKPAAASKPKRKPKKKKEPSPEPSEEESEEEEGGWWSNGSDQYDLEGGSGSKSKKKSKKSDKSEKDDDASSAKPRASSKKKEKEKEKDLDELSAHSQKSAHSAKSATSAKSAASAKPAKKESDKKSKEKGKLVKKKAEPALSYTDKELQKHPEIMPIQVPYFQLWRIDWTPYFCRTQY